MWRICTISLKVRQGIDICRRWRGLRKRMWIRKIHWRRKRRLYSGPPCRRMMTWRCSVILIRKFSASSLPPLVTWTTRKSWTVSRKDWDISHKTTWTPSSLNNKNPTVPLLTTPNNPLSTPKSSKLPFSALSTCTTISSLTILSEIRKRFSTTCDTIINSSIKMCMRLYPWPFISRMVSRILNMPNFSSIIGQTKRKPKITPRHRKISNNNHSLKLRKKKTSGSSSLVKTPIEATVSKYLTSYTN